MMIMKSKFMYLFATACIATAFTACSDNDGNELIDQQENSSTDRVADTPVQLQIKQMANTYASTSDATATAAKSQVGSTLDIFVFDDSGIFETYVNKTLTSSGTSGSGNDTYLTDTFMLSTGNKYFYVFTNVPSSDLLMPSSGTTRQTFELNPIKVTSVADIATDNQFYIGTLVASQTAVTGTSTNDPQTISLEVGRLASKIKLSETPATSNVSGNLKGTMSEPKYRIVNIPNQLYTVGQWDREFKKEGSQVRTPFYTGYTTWSDYYLANPTSWSGKGRGEIYYAIENTHEEPLRGDVTAAQIKYVYTPNAAEIYDKDNLRQNGTLSGTDFWVAEFKNGTSLIYNGDISGLDHPDYGIPTSVTEYTNGECFYTVFIADNSEATASLKYTVIRNHYYELKVNNIFRLGNNTDDITDPTEPVEKLVEIEVEIEVLPWFYIGQEVDL